MNEYKRVVQGVNVPTSTFTDRMMDRAMLRDFKIGEKAIKAKRKVYLPKFPTEDQSMYDNRVDNSYLYNILAISIRRASNKPLDKQIQILSDSEELNRTMFNFDNNGRSLLDFTRDFLYDSLWFNQGYAFVEDEDVSIIDVDNILQTEVIEGELIYIRFKDVLCRRNGWEDVKIEVVRIFEKVDGVVYYSYYVQQEENGDDFIEEIYMREYYLNEIPLVRYYPFGTKCEFNPDLTFQPTADIQKVLYKLDSDILNMLSIAAVPILFIKGVDLNDDSEPLSIDSYLAVYANTDNADMRYVEATCSALNTARQERDGLVEKVKSLTMDITKAMENITATASNIDASNNNVVMSSVAVGLQDFLKKIILLKYKFKRFVEVPDFAIQLTTDFSINTDVNELNFLTALFSGGVISKKLIFEEAQRRGIVTTEVTYAEDKDSKDAEMSSSSLYANM